MKNVYLRKMLILVLVTVVLSAALTAAVFWFYGGQKFADIKADELTPRASFIADITAEYVEGYIGIREYERIIKSQHAVWDAALYAFDAEGELFVWPLTTTNDDAAVANMQTYLADVLSGKTVVVTMTSSKLGVMVGTPVVTSFGNIGGAVFLIKPINELTTAMGGLFVTLVISMLLVSAIMVIPAYVGSRQLTRNMKQMNGVAKAMAHGDFSVRASTEGKDEIAQLGVTLNFLSSELEKTINDLTLERNRLRAVLDGLAEGIVAVDAHGVVTQSNISAARLMGGEPDGDIARLPVFAEAADEVAAVLSGGAPCESCVKHGNAELRLSITPLNDGEGSVVGAVVLIQDVTEAARLEQTRRDYVANVSHELRTPISSIRGLADALNDGLVKKDEDRTRYYGYILRESIRLSKLIDDLLELSRLQSGSVALTKQKLSVGELVMDVAERYDKVAREKGLSLEVSIAEDCETAYSNPDRAEQVLIALIDNAIKHAEGDGAVRVSVTDAGERLCVAVENPGEIDPEDAAHLFERFYKVDKSHSGGGTGLGLAISHEIMQLLGEEISVSCENNVVRFAFTLAKHA